MAEDYNGPEVYVRGDVPTRDEIVVASEEIDDAVALHDAADACELGLRDDAALEHERGVTDLGSYARGVKDALDWVLGLPGAENPVARFYRDHVDGHGVER